MDLSSLPALRIVILTNSITACVENFIRMETFPFWCTCICNKRWCHRRLSAKILSNSMITNLSSVKRNHIVLSMKLFQNQYVLVNAPSNLYNEAHQITKFKCVSSRLAVFLAEARCKIKNAPTTSVWSTFFPFLQRCVLYYIFNGRTKAYNMCAVGGIACRVATFLCLGIIITLYLLLMLMIYYANLVREMCKCMYTPFAKWCIVVYLLNVSWDIQTTSMEYGVRSTYYMNADTHSIKLYINKK